MSCPFRTEKVNEARGHLMYTNDSISGLCNFLKTTPENALKKMFVAGDFTDGHLRLILKVCRAAPEAEFMTYFNDEKLPQMFKLSPGEKKAQENFWPVCKKKFEQMGLIVAGKAA